MGTLGGGVAYDHGTHLLDQISLVFGLPSKVTGYLGVQRLVDGNGPLDVCTVVLHYKSDIQATIKASAMSADTEQLHFLVCGDERS